MKISEIQANQGSINVEGDVVEVGEVREFEKFGRVLRVSNAVLKDDSGTIKLTLWNQEIEKVHKGDKVKVTNGYARSFKDEIQLTAGKFGKIEVVDKSEAGAEAAPQEEPKAEASGENPLMKDEEEW